MSCIQYFHIHVDDILFDVCCVAAMNTYFYARKHKIKEHIWDEFVNFAYNGCISFVENLFTKTNKLCIVQRSNMMYIWHEHKMRWNKFEDYKLWRKNLTMS